MLVLRAAPPVSLPARRGLDPFRGGLLTLRPWRSRNLPALAALGALLFWAPLEAQDVELLGRIHGTRPPQGYYDLLAREPGAFQFQRALLRPGLGLRELPPIRPEGVAMEEIFTPAFAEALASGERASPVTGTYAFPLILGLFSDSPAPAAGFGRAEVQGEFWDGPNSRYKTIPEFYGELSGGLVTLRGVTFDWRRTALTQAAVTAGESGLGSKSRTGEFIVQILQLLDDGSIDWGQFDNDGPDGIPNSGDDDGYVDILTIMHPTPGGECQHPERPNRIWSHKWNLYSAAVVQGGAWATPIRADTGYTTKTPRTGGGFIRVLDYTIQPVSNCAGSALNEIGVFAHELGHGFGLPDLYAVGADHAGIGNWGLMGTGSWGCNGATPQSPCHMSAWSKAVLGWAEVVTLPPGAELGALTLNPVLTGRTLYQVDAGDGSGEYLLLENRQRLGFDQYLYQPGLLVWHIDPGVVAARWRHNTVNSDPQRMGVWLREADGLNDLARPGGGRGGPGDPFPGAHDNRSFHAGSTPAARSHGGTTMGITLLDIGQAGEAMTFEAWTRYQTLSFRTVGSITGTGLVAVDGYAPPALEWTLPSAPFERHILEAAPGQEVGAGIRVGFQGWSDGAPRIREHVTGFTDESFTATYGGREVRLKVDLTSPVPGIAPGAVSFVPGDEEGWVPEGATVAVTALPRTGFGFREWTGAFAGRPNPFTHTATEPLQGGALFDLTFSASANPASVSVEAAAPHVLTLQVANANPPVNWTLLSGALPLGMHLDEAGEIRGTAMDEGSYPLALRVRDGIGLQADVALEMVVVPPVIPIEILAAPFLLTGHQLTLDQRVYLDRQGNRNGAYDLGDFRAFLLANPNLPVSAEPRAVAELLVPLGSLPKPLPATPNERREEIP